MEELVKSQFEQKARLTARTLIEKRELIQNKKNAKICIEVAELGEFVFRLPTIVDIEDSGALDNDDAMLVYTCCLEPNLKDTELHAAYGVTHPVDIVHEIFLPGEVARISRELVQRSGYGEDAVKVIDAVKN